IEYVLRSSISGVVVCTTASTLCGLGNSHRLNLKRLLRLSLRGGLLSRRLRDIARGALNVLLSHLKDIREKGLVMRGKAHNLTRGFVIAVSERVARTAPMFV